MQIKQFRGDEFINREKEIKFIKDWVNRVPKEILWIYGPKSTGKTTLIEYVIEKELIKDFKLFSQSKYWIKYINFRRTMVGSYDSFINSFFEETDEQGENVEELMRKYKLWVFELKASTMKKIKEKKKNLFPELIGQLKLIEKKKIIVIDEIQALEDIYYNGEKGLLKEFLNFCVALTKELHLSHVIILSSNTIFIDRIYNDAKLKMTSSFYKVGHFDKETTFEYLKYKISNSTYKIQNSKLEMIWDYLGGCIPLLQRIFNNISRYKTLEEYLNNELKNAISEIRHILRMEMDFREIDIFKEIIKIIIKEGYFQLKEKEDKTTIQVINFMCEKEILFFDPLDEKITGNNRLYEKAFKKILGDKL